MSLLVREELPLKSALRPSFYERGFSVPHKAMHRSACEGRFRHLVGHLSGTDSTRDLPSIAAGVARSQPRSKADRIPNGPNREGHAVCATRRNFPRDYQEALTTSRGWKRPSGRSETRSRRKGAAFVGGERSGMEEACGDSERPAPHERVSEELRHRT